MANEHDSKLTADANPSKSFFISMLTRDIGLSDCILDLIDNSVDGIVAAAKREGRQLPSEGRYRGHKVDINFDSEHFSIADCSGGIPLSVAKEYAFRFGRPDEAPELTEKSIGLYGIGMKRAMFKMGKHILLVSSTGSESFELDLEVERWRRDPTPDWSFELKNVRRGGTDVPVGTQITITELYETISREFKNPHFFDTLYKTISRDYAFILSEGLSVFVNQEQIKGSLPSLRESADIQPFRYRGEIDGVTVEITAGLADPPPDDTSATARYPDVEVYGWYVVCNERVVVTADKSSLTGWGRKPVSTWHPQYMGFVGVARFSSDDPRKLPWKTTKRDVETSNAVYQQALVMMMNATKKFIDYTNARRAEAKRVKRIERQAERRPITRVTSNTQLKFPEIKKSDLVQICYTKSRDEIEAVSEALRLEGSSPSEIGIRTFEYCYEREVRK